MVQIPYLEEKLPVSVISRRNGVKTAIQLTLARDKLEVQFFGPNELIDSTKMFKKVIHSPIPVCTAEMAVNPPFR